MLVTTAMLEQMKPGSVVIDLAAESGGNVEGSVPGKVVAVGETQLWGAFNVPSSMPQPASRLLAQNIVNLVALLSDGAELAPDFADEIVAGCCVTHAGEVRHAATRKLLTPTEGAFS